MDEMLNIELTGIQQEWSLDILLNESNRLNNTIKGIDESIIQEGIGEFAKKVKDAVIKFFKWIIEKIVEIFRTIRKNIIKFYNEKILTMFIKLKESIDKKKKEQSTNESFDVYREDFNFNKTKFKNNCKVGLELLKDAAQFFVHDYEGDEIKFGEYFYGAEMYIYNIVTDIIDEYEESTKKLITDSSKVNNTQNKNSMEPEKEAIRNFVDDIVEEKEKLKYITVNKLSNGKVKNTGKSIYSFIQEYYKDLNNVGPNKREITSENIYNEYYALYNSATSFDRLNEDMNRIEKDLKKFLETSKNEIIKKIDERFSQEDFPIISNLNTYISTCTSLACDMTKGIEEVGIYWTLETAKIINSVIREFQHHTFGPPQKK